MPTIRPSSKQVRKNIYTDVPQQFPGIYREEGPIFVDFVKAYYKYVDTRQNDFREAFSIRDIDTTFERFLIYFKKKYLNALPLKPDNDTRFLLKHIQDLYRRKGSTESIELLFKMFFDEEIEVFYPSYYVLRISDSKYGSTRYLEMQPVMSIENYPIRKGDKISGDTSKATAFVDEIVFQNIKGLIVPTIYMSNIRGEFTTDDNLNVQGRRNNTIIDQSAGQRIHGSISNLAVKLANRAAGNKVGDRLIVRSKKDGINATASVAAISEAATAVIDFSITDGGWGYSAAVSDNIIQTSTGTIAYRLFPDTVFNSGYTPNANQSAFPKIGDYFISDSTYSAGTARYNSGESTLNGTTNFAYGQVVGVDTTNNLVFIDFATEGHALNLTNNTLYDVTPNAQNGYDVYFYDKGYLISGTNIATEFSLYVSGGSYEAGLDAFFEDNINGRKRFDVTNSGTITTADYNAVNAYFNSELTDATQRAWIKTNIEQYLLDNIDKVVGGRSATGYWPSVTAAEFINDTYPHVNPGTGYPKTGFATAASPFNDTAKYRIGSITDTETVSFIPDVIGDFLDVQLENQTNPAFTNYGMSGAGFENLNTTLLDAFDPVTYIIGSIDSLVVTNNGQGYQADVKSLITQTEVAKYDRRDMGILFESPTFVIQAGDIMTQTIQVEQFETGQFDDYTVKAKFLRREGDVFYFRPNSFYQFDADLPISFRGESYNVLRIVADDNSLPIGQNAVIDGQAQFARGQIEQLNILTTGFRFQDGEEVEIIGDEKLLRTTDSNGAVVTIANPNYGNVVALADASVLGTGTSEAGWLTTTSFLNDPTKVIHDNYYYQEYSFDIRSIVSPDDYEEMVKDIVQPSGTKQFNSSLINTLNYVNVDLDASMEVYTFSYEPISTETANTVVDTLGVEVDNVVTDELVATIQALDETLSNQVTEDINN